MLILYFPLPIFGQRLVPPRTYYSEDEDDDDQPEVDELDEANSTGNILLKFRLK